MLIVKIVISILLVMIPLIICRVMLSRIDKYDSTISLLKATCTKKLLVPLWMCKDEGPNKWSALYRYTYKNTACVYKTPPRSNKKSKPKPKSKIPIYINPMSPQQAYDPSDYIDIDAKKSKKNIFMLTIGLFVLNIGIIVIMML